MTFKMEQNATATPPVCPECGPDGMVVFIIEEIPRVKDGAFVCDAQGYKITDRREHGWWCDRHHGWVQPTEGT